MKAILTSIFILLITFSCKTVKPPVTIDNLNIEIKESIIVTADLIWESDLNKSNIEDYEFGFIYQKNAEEENINYFTLNNNLENVTANVDNDLNMYYSFDDFTVFDYVIPISIRGYVITDKEKVIYTKDVKTYKIYELAFASNSTLAKRIIDEVGLNIDFAESFNLEFLIDNNNRGFKVKASFNEYNENHIYGIIYKYNASKVEQDNFNFNVNDYYIVYESELDAFLEVSFNEVSEASYFYDITFRSFVYNKDSKSFTFIDRPITTSLYDLALLDDSAFSEYVVSKVVVIDELFINTDVLGEYEVGSHSEGVNVVMEYDYLTVRLIITVKEGYRFSNDISFEDIEILRVDDDIRVDNFTMEVTGVLIIIEYDDYGWGPPM